MSNAASNLKHDMNPDVARHLQEIVDQLGDEIIGFPARLEGMLRDNCPDQNQRLSIDLLLSALRQDVVRDLRRMPTPLSPRNIETLTQRLQQEKGYSESNASWAVTTWAVALHLAVSTTSRSPSSVTIPPVQIDPQNNRPAQASNNLSSGQFPKVHSGHSTTSKPKKPLWMGLGAWGGGVGCALLAALWGWQALHRPSSPSSSANSAVPSGIGSAASSAQRKSKNPAVSHETAQAETQAQQARSIKKAAIEEMLDVRKKAQSGLLTRAEIENQQIKLRRSLASSLDCAEKALRLDPSNRTAWEQKTAVLYLLERFGEGLESAERGLKLYPKDVDLLDAKDKIQTKMRGSSQGTPT